MTRYLLLSCCLLTFGFLKAQLNENSQRYDRSGKPYPLRKAQDIPELSLLEYSAPENPYYWKNRPPYEGYWQQDVHYLIEAELDVTAHLIRGSLQLTYRNNSPDTLECACFHLYQNAFLPDSYR